MTPHSRFAEKSQTKTQACITTVFISHRIIEVHSVNKYVMETVCKMRAHRQPNHSRCATDCGLVGSVGARVASWGLEMQLVP